MRPVQPITRKVAHSLALLCNIVFVATTAAEPIWHRYENSHFIAYSNASQKNVENILESLEQFRAAASLVPTFVVPEGRPKTLVILPATHKEFLAFAYYETIAGFAAVLDGQPTIVLPASDHDLNIQVIVGHEFAHTLLLNEYFTYPSWYAEGFAEIASSITIDHKNSTFTIGTRPDLIEKVRKPTVDWNDLVQSEFNAHSLGDPNRTASAYAQDWLLVHYLTLNKSPDYASELNLYFSNLNNGIPANAAFMQAFGKTAADFWQSHLQPYLKQIRNQEYVFDPTLIDPDFQSSVAIEDEFHPILKFLKDNADLRHGRNVPVSPLSHLPGQWDWLSLEDQCADPVRFHLRENTGVLVLESFYSDDDLDPVPALFNIETEDDGTLVLTNITSDEYPQVRVASDYRAVMRSENVMCFDAQPAARDCLRVLHRCE
ncbi:MAG: hypothetical protein O2880_01150 [Proteobacteria bacterium]|nr:hypothetical protein [Pseudomonadota bacterium]